MIIEHANVPTGNASRYLQQLCKHWSHKLQVEFTEEEGTVRFETATARMGAAPAYLRVQLEAEDDATIERLKKVMAEHLDRFAFREAPLRFDWTKA